MAAAPEKLTPENTKIRKVDQNVEVSFDVTVDKLKPNYKVVISPVLYNGTNRQALDETVVTGKRRSLYETRNRETADKGTAIARKELPATIRYRAIVPYRDWMSSVSLAVGQTVTGCCSEETRADRILAADKLLYYEIDPAFGTVPLEYQLTELEKYSLENPFLHPVEDYPNRYDILFNERDKGTSVVQFKVGSHMIDMNIPGNKELLNAVGKAFRLILDDPNASLKQIVIAATPLPKVRWPLTPPLHKNGPNRSKTTCSTTSTCRKTTNCSNFTTAVKTGTACAGWSRHRTWNTARRHSISSTATRSNRKRGKPS